MFYFIQKKIETESHPLAQAGMKYNICSPGWLQTRDPLCLRLLSAGVTGLSYHTWLHRCLRSSFPPWFLVSLMSRLADHSTLCLEWSACSKRVKHWIKKWVGTRWFKTTGSSDCSSRGPGFNSEIPLRAHDTL